MPRFHRGEDPVEQDHAGYHGIAGEMAGQKPFVSVEEGSVTIAYRGRTVTVPLL